MRPRDAELAAKFEADLMSFHKERRPLSGIENPAIRRALIEQMLESVHRIRFVEVLREREISPRRADPKDVLFDPLKAAIIHQREKSIEEAFWLVFLFVHFGKNGRGGWRYAREVYGRLGSGDRWSWNKVSTDLASFREWLHCQQSTLRRTDVPGGFGNHRKRESLDGYSLNGTGAVVESYVKWIAPPRTHQELIAECVAAAAGDRRKTFDVLFKSMEAVHRFGRLAKFDYLTMVGKLDLAPIEPGSAYMQGSTGPVKGARLLFGTTDTAPTLDQYLIELDAKLGVGMQVLEDALCNWQKNPAEFVPFRG